MRSNRPRRCAAQRHPSPLIEWLDDSLPGLTRVSARRQRFDLILLSAVWMHLDARQRRIAMPNVAALLRPAGVMTMTLRHGPVPAGRRMFPVTGKETIGLAEAAGLQTVLHRQGDDGVQLQPGISWTRLAFVRPGAL